MAVMRLLLADKEQKKKKKKFNFYSFRGSGKTCQLRNPFKPFVSGGISSRSFSSLPFSLGGFPLPAAKEKSTSEDPLPA
jgi:hypothetical protein